MFKITPVHDAALISKYLDECSLKKVDGAFLYAMCDAECGELMGLSQFDIKDSGYIYDLCLTEKYSGDFEAVFILGRQTMNFINLCGIRFCKASGDFSDKQLIRALGFKENDGGFLCDMKGMFDGSHCSGHTKS